MAEEKKTVFHKGIFTATIKAELDGTHFEIKPKQAVTLPKEKADYLIGLYQDDLVDIETLKTEITATAQDVSGEAKAALPTDANADDDAKAEETKPSGKGGKGGK